MNYTWQDPEGQWVEWANDQWTRLRAGGRLPAPSWLPHPREAGFVKPAMAEDHGQIRDWVLGITDGSRLHVHECDDGRMVVHRDRWDPDVSPVHAVAHVLFETTAGKVLGVTGLVGLVAASL